MAEARATVIPNFLSASSPRALRRLMLMTNKRLGAWHNYQIQFVNGKWFAWYHEEITRSNLNELIEDPKSGEIK
jgi:hypothetical protein